MSWIYPDNKNRYDRVNGLAVSVGAIQQEILDSINRQTAQNVITKQVMQRLITKWGYSTVEEVKAHVRAGLQTDELRKQYDELGQALDGSDSIVDDLLDYLDLSLIAAEKSADIAASVIKILSNGALMAGADLVSRGFGRILHGAFAEGANMIRNGIRAGRIVAANVEAGENAQKFIRFFKAGAEVLSLIAVVLEGIILIFQAVEGAKQKEELKRGIFELVCRRLTAKELEQNTFAVENFVKEIHGFLVTADQLPVNPETDRVLNKLNLDMSDHVHNQLAAITSQALWDKLHTEDVSNGQWLNEDPNLQQALDWIAKQPDT